MTRLKEGYKNPTSMRGRTRKFDPRFWKVRPSQERLRYLFDYDPEGSFRVKNICSPMSRATIGGIVKGGVDTSGYRRIHIDGVYYSLHRLVWLYHNGYWPENQIDHVNRVRSDNRIENLREVSQTCNARNCSLQIRNSSGVKGVGWHKKDCRWAANIRVVALGGLKYLGEFEDLIEAVAHRYAAEQCLDWHQCDKTSSAYKYLKQQGVLK